MCVCVVYHILDWCCSHWYKANRSLDLLLPTSQLSGRYRDCFACQPFQLDGWQFWSQGRAMQEPRNARAKSEQRRNRVRTSSDEVWNSSTYPFFSVQCPPFFADVAGLEFQTRSHSHKTDCYPNKQYAEGLQELLGKAEAGP